MVFIWIFQEEVLLIERGVTIAAMKALCFSAMIQVNICCIQVRLDMFQLPLSWDAGTLSQLLPSNGRNFTFFCYTVGEKWVKGNGKDSNETLKVLEMADR